MALQTHKLHQEGVLPDETYRKSMRLICSLCAYPGGGNWWAARKHHFDDDFVAAVDTFLACDEHAPMYEYAIARAESGEQAK